MTLQAKIKALLNYINQNPQESYEKARLNLADLLTTLSASSSETELHHQTYQAQLTQVVSTYCSKKVMSPLMYAAHYALNDLIKDIVLVPYLDIDDAYNHKETYRLTNWSGGYEKKITDGEKYGYTALLFAVEGEHYQTIKLLLKHFASPQKIISDNKRVIDYAEPDSEIFLLLSHAKVEQIHNLSVVLAQCKDKDELEFLIKIQHSLGIQKNEIVDYLIGMHEENILETKTLLDKALDFDDFGVPNNPLAEYMQISQNLIGGADLATLKTLQEYYDNSSLPKGQKDCDAGEFGVGKVYILQYRNVNNSIFVDEKVYFDPQLETLADEQIISDPRFSRYNAL